MTSTLIIWEEIPENTKLFLIPNEVADKHREYLTQCQNKYINSNDMNEGLSFLNYALAKEGDVDDTKSPYAGLFASYEVKLNQPLTNQHITHVYHTGFIL